MITRLSHKWVIHSQAENYLPSYSPHHNPEDLHKLTVKAELKELLLDEKNEKGLIVFESGRAYSRSLATTTPRRLGEPLHYFLGEVAKQKDIEREAAKVGRVEGSAAKKAFLSRFKAYSFTLKAQRYIKATSKAGLGIFANHNGTGANMRFEIDNNNIHFFATKNLRAGSVLLFDYGDIYAYGSHIFDYIHPWQNYMLPSMVLQKNEEDYASKPHTLTVSQQQAFNIPQNQVLIPTYLDLLIKGEYKSAQQLIDRDPTVLDLPLIEINAFMQPEVGLPIIHVPRDIHYIDPLLYACAIKDKKVIAFLCYNKVDVYSRTTSNIDALLVLARVSAREQEFIELALPIIEKMNDRRNLSGPLGSISMPEGLGNTILHVLVEKEWCQALNLFKNKKLFQQNNNEGYDPIMYAIANKKLKAVSTLMNMGLGWHLRQAECGAMRKKQFYVLLRAMENALGNGNIKSIQPLYKLLLQATKHNQITHQIVVQCKTILAEKGKSAQKTIVPINEDLNSRRKRKLNPKLNDFVLSNKLSKVGLFKSCHAKAQGKRQEEFTKQINVR